MPGKHQTLAVGSGSSGNRRSYAGASALRKRGRKPRSSGTVKELTAGCSMPTVRISAADRAAADAYLKLQTQSTHLRLGASVVKRSNSPEDESYIGPEAEFVATESDVDPTEETDVNKLQQVACKIPLVRLSQFQKKSSRVEKSDGEHTRRTRQSRTSESPNHGCDERSLPASRQDVGSQTVSPSCCAAVANQLQMVQRELLQFRLRDVLNKSKQSIKTAGTQTERRSPPASSPLVRAVESAGTQTGRLSPQSPAPAEVSVASPALQSSSESKPVHMIDFLSSSSDSEVYNVKAYASVDEIMEVDTSEPCGSDSVREPLTLHSPVPLPEFLSVLCASDMEFLEQEDTHQNEASEQSLAANSAGQSSRGADSVAVPGQRQQQPLDEVTPTISVSTAVSCGGCWPRRRLCVGPRHGEGGDHNTQPCPGCEFGAKVGESGRGCTGPGDV